MAKQPIFGTVQKHPKEWGEEIWVVNIPQYCGKLLNFKEGASFSMHYHIQKEETWAVLAGTFRMEYFDLVHAERQIRTLEAGETVHLEPSVPHKLTCIKGEGSIFEVSTQHFNEDSYRIEKGDSQK